MPTRELTDLTWEDVRDLDRARAVALLPVGAIEAHGPHLPLGTDVVIARAMARAAGARLESLGLTALVLPPIAFTSAPFAAAFPGTLSASPTSVTAQVLDLAGELTRHGFAALGIANAHLDPAHLEGLRQAADLAAESKDVLPVVFPDLTRKPWASRLGEEFRSGACHAGRFETSVVMAECPALVREHERRDLPPNPASLSVAIRDGFRTFEEAGGPRAYFGWPADASAEEGRATIETLGGILADAVSEALAGERTT
jgi:creatinine amidohydrolase